MKFLNVKTTHKANQFNLKNLPPNNRPVQTQLPLLRQLYGNGAQRPSQVMFATIGNPHRKSILIFKMYYTLLECRRIK